MTSENPTRPAPETTPKWGEWVIARSLIILVLGVVGASLAAGAMLSASTAALVSVVPIWVAIVVAILWAVRREGSGSLVRDLRLRFRVVDVVVGFLGGVAVAFVAVVFTALITGQLPFAAPGIEVVSGGRPLSYWIATIALPLVAAVFEESFFRGLLQPAFSHVASGLGASRRTAGVLAIALTTVCFVAFHLVLNPSGGAVAALVLLLVSVACGVAAHVSGRLGPAIIIHITYNAMTVLS